MTKNNQILANILSMTDNEFSKFVSLLPQDLLGYLELVLIKASNNNRKIEYK